MYLIQGVRSHISRCCAAWIVCLAALFLSCLLALPAHAYPPPPSVTFVGAQSTVGVSSDWNGPVGVAADANGNLYVASYAGAYISQVSLATGAVTRINDFNVLYPQDMKIVGDTLYIASQGQNLIKGYSLSTHALVKSLSMPGIFALAVDSAGDIYAGVDAGSSSAIYVFAAGSSTATPVKTSGFTSMTGLAVDSAGMLYASDTSANTIYKLDPSNGYAITTVPISVTSPRGMTIDSTDRLYLAVGGNISSNNGYVYRYPAGSYSTSSGVMLAQGLNYDEEVTIASNGDEYVTSYLGNSVIRISPQSNFGTIVPVGSTSSQTLVFSIGVGTTIGSVVAGAVDVSIGNFTITNNTCTAGTYSSATVCSLTLQYSPLQPAVTHGTVQILNGSGTPLSTVYTSGIGVAPQIAFAPSATSVNPGVGTLYGIAPLPGNMAAVTTDSALYIGNFSAAPTLISSGLAQPQEIAVDAQNNLFIADTGNRRVITVPGNGTPATPTTFSTSTASFSGVAIDGAGSVYYADATNSQIIRRDWADTAYGIENVVATGIANLGAIAVDNAHNLYVVSGNNVLELTWQNGVYGAPVIIGSGFSSPGGIALDGAGDVYVSDSGNQNFVEIPNIGGTYGSAFTLLSGQGDLQQAIVEPNGSLYIVAGTTGKVVYAPRNSTTLNFGATTLLTTNSNGPLAAQVQNIGTSAAIFPPAAGGNPTTNSTSFTLNTGSTTCPVASTTAQTLSSGSSCAVAIDYTPQTTSATSGTVTFTDNALNTPNSTQSVSLTGTVTLPTPIVTAVSPNSGYVNGGNTVAISGSNFTGAAAVLFGTKAATFTTNSDSSITATVPTASSLQVVDITVTTTSGGTSATGTADEYTYIAQVPSLAFATIGTHIFGDAAFAVSATSASTGAVTYTVVSGPATVSGSTVTLTGAGTVTLQASQAAAGTYAATTTTASFSVNKATPTVAVTPTGNSTYGAPLGSQITATATLNGTSIPGTYTYTVTPVGGSPTAANTSTVLGAGSYTVTTTFTPADTTDYKPVVSITSLTIAAQPITVNIASSSVSTTPGQPVTLSVSVTGTADTVPNGSVVIMDNGVVIATVPVNNGVATFTSTSLSSGSHTLTATYTGNGNYTGSPASGTGVVNVTVAQLDFAMTATGASYQTVIPGNSTSYNFALSPTYTSYPAAVTFAVTGLPTGASYTITPSTVAANAGATTAVLTVKTASAAASNHLLPTVNGGDAASGVLAILLLPFATARRLRKSGKLGRLLMIVIIAGAGLLSMVGLTGCGSGNGFLGQAPTNYTITVTATSGTVQHASTVTLNLQ